MEVKETVQVVEDFKGEVRTWLKENNLTTLPDYVKLNDKVVLGTHYRNDQVYYEKLSDYKSTCFALIAYFNGTKVKAVSREDIRLVDFTVDSLNTLAKEIDSKIEAGRKRLDFYKTVVYMIGNVIYGVN